MQVNQITSAIEDILAPAREAAAVAASATGSAERDYSLALNEAFATLSVQWYTIEHNAKGAEANLIHDEKAKFFKLLHEKHYLGKHSNPSTVWARVRKEAANAHKEALRVEAAATGEAVPAELMEAADSTGARHRKSLTLSYTEGLSNMYRKGRKAEKEGTISEREKRVHLAIIQGLNELGIDINTL